ncbi:MAG: hypothetical protein MI920_02025, partial [Kiloniellales bacterium]|nr:hypothetical protein [Kiloniellales bacterium]
AVEAAEAALALTGGESFAGAGDVTLPPAEVAAQAAEVFAGVIALSAQVAVITGGEAPVILRAVLKGLKPSPVLKGSIVPQELQDLLVVHAIPIGDDYAFSIDGAGIGPADQVTRAEWTVAADWVSEPLLKATLAAGQITMADTAEGVRFIVKLTPAETGAVTPGAHQHDFKAWDASGRTTASRGTAEFVPTLP